MTPKEALLLAKSTNPLLRGSLPGPTMEGYVERIIEALEKQIPKPTNVDGAWNYCPTCGASIPCSVFHKPNYCHSCGQRIQLPKGDE